MTDRTQGKLKMLDWLEDLVDGHLQEVPDLEDDKFSEGEKAALQGVLTDIITIRMIVKQSIDKCPGKDIPQIGWDMGGSYDAN